MDGWLGDGCINGAVEMQNKAFEIWQGYRMCPTILNVAHISTNDSHRCDAPLAPSHHAHNMWVIHNSQQHSQVTSQHYLFKNEHAWSQIYSLVVHDATTDTAHPIPPCFHCAFLITGRCMHMRLCIRKVLGWVSVTFCQQLCRACIWSHIYTTESPTLYPCLQLCRQRKS